MIKLWGNNIIMLGGNRGPDSYDELGAIRQDDSFVVTEDGRQKGVVELSYDWDGLDYTLDLSEEYSDSAHLDALDHLTERYDDEDLPEEITVSDIQTVSSAYSSPHIEVDWEPEIEVGLPAPATSF